MKAVLSTVAEMCGNDNWVLGRKRGYELGIVEEKTGID
jgi:hypothetical protein